MQILAIKSFSEDLNDWFYKDPEEIKNWLYSIGLNSKNFKLNPDNSVEVNSVDVFIDNDNIRVIPVHFKRVSGNFVVKSKKLISLLGCPEVVGMIFAVENCSALQTLEGAPERVRMNFSVKNCSSLRILKTNTINVKRDFIVEDCPNLISLEGSPKEVGGNYVVRNCMRLESSKGINRVDGKIDISGTKLSDLVVVLSTKEKTGALNNVSMITKNITSLNKEMSYPEIKSYAKNLSLAGYSDWRLPTLDEALTIYDNFLKQINTGRTWSFTTSTIGKKLGHPYCVDKYRYIFEYPLEGSVFDMNKDAIYQGIFVR